MRNLILVPFVGFFWNASENCVGTDFFFESGVQFAIDDRKVDQSFRSTRSLIPSDFRYFIVFVFQGFFVDFTIVLDLLVIQSFTS